MVDKFLFNGLPSLMRSPKMLYSELMIHYGFVKAAMPSNIKEALYRSQNRALLVGSETEGNKMGSSFHDEALDMRIILHLKSLK